MYEIRTVKRWMTTEYDLMEYLKQHNFLIRLSIEEYDMYYSHVESTTFKNKGTEDMRICFSVPINATMYDNLHSIDLTDPNVDTKIIIANEKYDLLLDDTFPANVITLHTDLFNKPHMKLTFSFEQLCGAIQSEYLRQLALV